MLDWKPYQYVHISLQLTDYISRRHQGIPGGTRKKAIQFCLDLFYQSDLQGRPGRLPKHLRVED